MIVRTFASRFFSALAFGALLGVVSAAPCAAPIASAQSRDVRIALVEQPNSLDPLHASEFYENYLDEAIFSALVVLDGHEQPSPDLATVVPTRANGGISADGKTITYHLRPNARWQDGVPLTSHDVAFTFAAMRDPRTAFTEGSVYGAIDRIETPDDHTVVMRLKAPWADATVELFVGGQNGSILPEHLLKSTAIPIGGAFESAPLGSGPYSLERWDRGSRIVLRASPNYFRGKPPIDRIIVSFVPDRNTLALQLRTGEIDFSPQLTATSALQLAGIPRLFETTAPTYLDEELGFNTREAPFDDARVRRALVLAIDRKQIVATVFHGRAVPADDLVPPISPFHTADPKRPASGDFAQASRLLDAAGWKMGPGNVRQKNGRPLRITLSLQAGDAQMTGAAVQIQAEWTKLGVQSDLRPVVTNQLYGPIDGLLARGQFDAYLQDDGFATAPDRLDRFGIKAIPPGLNYPRYADPGFDRLALEARATGDFARRKALYATISARIRDAAPLEPLLWIEDPYVYDANLAGLQPETVNSDFWNVYAWHWK